MVVTINTDASFNRLHSIGTYAFWIICDQTQHKQSGVLRKKVTKPEQAEFKCIINALHVCGKIIDFKKVGLIVINTDCLNVIHLVNQDTKAIARYKLDTWGGFLLQEYLRTLASLKIKPAKIRMRHVPSHQKIITSRQYCNEWCDREAKLEIDKAIKSKKAAK